MDAWSDRDALSEIDTAANTARSAAGGELRLFSLQPKPVLVNVRPFVTAAPPRPARDDTGEDESAFRQADFELEDASLARITTLEAALGDANRELRARAEVEEQLRARVADLMRVIDEQRCVMDAKDAEIVRLTAQARLAAEAPKRTRLRRPTRTESPRPLQEYQLAHAAAVPSASAVPTLPPLGGARSLSSLL